MTDLTPKENAALDMAVTRLGQVVEKMERASHPYPRSRTWGDAEAELLQAKAEIERLRGLLQAAIEPRGEGVTLLVPYDWCLRVREALGNDH